MFLRFRSSLESMFSKNRRSRKSTLRSKPQDLEYGKLETKNLLASITSDVNSGTIFVEGSESADLLMVTQVNNKTTQYRVELVTTTEGTLVSFFDTIDFETIVANGLGGNDTLNINANLLARIDGGSGNDVIRGNFFADDLRGGSGNDSIFGRGGNDFLRGGGGNDTLNGQDGNDRLIGNSGDDTYLFTAATSFETDRIVERSGQGSDQLHFLGLPTGQNLNVDLSVTGSNPVIASHTNRAVRSGNVGNIEEVWGSNGDDVLIGNQANNELLGFAGNDTIDGRGGGDFLSGGTGNDTFLFGVASNQEFDTIDERDGGGFDRLDFLGIETGDSVLVDLFDTLGNRQVAVHQNRTISVNAVGNEEFFETIIGSRGNDTLIGNLGANSLFGVGGNDRLEGRGGNDFLQGGAGDDVLLGANGNDRLEGREGNDRLFGGNDNDNLRGNEGSDFLNGQNGDDNLFGGFDGVVDTLEGGNGADRYLRENTASLDNPTIDQVIGVQIPEDGLVNFVNPFFTAVGDVGQWTDAKIEQIDEILDRLTERTGNNQLLSTYGAVNIEDTLVQSGLFLANDLPAPNIGSNAPVLFPMEFFPEQDQFVRSRLITIFDNAFSHPDLTLEQVVLHEIGHSWHNPGPSPELVDLDILNPFWEQFLAVSGWTQEDQSGNPDFIESGDGSWWFLADSEFSVNGEILSDTNRGRLNPREDWSTMWEDYFLISTTGTGELGQKLDLIDQFFDFMASV